MTNERGAATKVCPECSTAYTPRKVSQDFCCEACRTNWNNRRKMRGAVLYDYWMAHRVNRGKQTGYLRAMSRLTTMWRIEDQKAGRSTSWNDPDSDKNPNRALVLGATVYRP